VEHVSEQGDALLPERIDPEVAKAAIQTVPRIIMGKQEADVNRLRSITARVDESVSKYLTLLYNQQAELVKQFHQRVEGVRPEIAAQVDNYQTEMSSKIEAIKERFAPWLSTLEADISSWSEREHQWAEEESAHKRSLDEARRAKESASRRLEALKRRQDSEAQRVIHNYANLIEEEWRKIDFLEVERNREADNLQRAQEEIVTLRRRVAGDFSSLMRRVNRLHDVHVRSQGETLQRLYRSSPQIVTVHFPIWICVMESPRGWHYWVFPPVVMVKPSSGLRHLFGTFAGPVLSVEPQARKLYSLLKRKLEDALRRDPSLERQVREKALESNALESPLIVDALDRGLRYLMNHQNLKPEEAQTFDQLFRSLAMSPSGDKG